jgi:hypothetical protein
VIEKCYIGVKINSEIPHWSVDSRILTPKEQSGNVRSIENTAHDWYKSAARKGRFIFYNLGER